MKMLSSLCLELGGIIKPLLIPIEKDDNPSLTNPSILVENGEIIVNLRSINYVLYHSEKGKFENMSWGPLCYLHRENDQRLLTKNIICRLDGDLNIINNQVIDTAFLDKSPLWEFVGLEDGRLVRWDDKLYLSGVRRDTTTNGVGRMELSEIEFKNGRALETRRIRIPSPGLDDSYCEKNWMPVLDKKYTYIKWTNPTEVVEINISDTTCSTVKLGDYKSLGCGELRGGSQVVFMDGRYIAIVHEADLFNSEAGKKNAIYTHRFVVWDKDFNFWEMSDKFSFMGANIEFCCGMAEMGEDILVTFGFQDNAAFILRMPKNILGRFLKSYA